MRTGKSAQAAYTLVEVLIALGLSLILMSGVLSTFVYLARSLARLANQQTLETEGRRAVQYFTQDVRMATNVTSASDTAVTLTVPTAAGSVNIAYTYDAGASTFTRQVGTAAAVTLARDVSSFDFEYYDTYDIAITDSLSSRRRNIKKISFSYASQTGTVASGARTPVHRVTTANLLLRNKTGYEN